jgi:hypothetical protein
MYGRYKNWHMMDVAEIQPKRKEVPYTITSIGGPAELKAWKAEQILMREARDAIQKPIQEALRLKVIGMVEAQNHDLHFSPEERAEIAYRTTRDARHAPTTPKVVHYQPVEDQKPSWSVLGAVKRLLKNAFPD